MGVRDTTQPATSHWRWRLGYFIQRIGMRVTLSAFPRRQLARCSPDRPCEPDWMCRSCTSYANPEDALWEVDQSPIAEMRRRVAGKRASE